MPRRLVVHVVGARPNYMKVAPVYAALEAGGEVEQQLVHTGQHYDSLLKDRDGTSACQSAPMIGY